jgi:hypothetical protein
MRMFKTAMAYMEGYISGFDWRKRFVKSKIFRVKFSWAPSEYCQCDARTAKLAFMYANVARTYISYYLAIQE